MFTLVIIEILVIINMFLLHKFALNHLKFQFYEYLHCTLWKSVDIPDTSQERIH